MIPIALVVERPERWPLDLPGVEILAARAYLTDPAHATRRLRVFNLCRTYRYQSLGYYVSLLAEARGHRPLPNVATLRDLDSPSHVRLVSEDLEEIIESSLRPIGSESFTLSVYFGRNLAERHRRLALHLFQLFPAPLLRAEFFRSEDGWRLRRLRPIAIGDVPETHREFLVGAAEAFFAGRGPRKGKPKAWRYDLALLVDPEEEFGPSDEKALRKIEKAGERVGLRVTRIGRDDFAHLAEYDALFLRQTTEVEHYTYRFARRAEAEGLVVIDDPLSILRCTNKVYLAEILARGGIPTPKTVVVHRDNLDEALELVGLPAVLKLPDGSFSRAVVKAADAGAFHEKARAFLEQSDLVIAQEWLPTDFDWRVGLLDGEALFAARYQMAKGHWQIARTSATGQVRYGGVDAVALDEVPASVLRAAVDAGALVGRGFYGVDVKERDGRAYVIEVNDNPNLDAGCEDAVLGDALYDRLMAVFLERIEAKKKGIEA